jgi:serine/threonine protein kinase HipA of HipAB toxin-antitoxin module
MTKRFDRTDDVGKLQMQTLGGLAGFDYNQPDKYSYETGGNETRIHQIQKTYRLSLLE